MRHAERRSNDFKEAFVEADPATNVEHLAVVGIGASAGGVQALQAFFDAVPASTGMAFVVVVHLSPDRESRMAEVLQSVAAIPVHEVTGTTQMQPDHAYVIPPGKHIDLTDGHLSLSEIEEPRWKGNPIDHFFRTLADTHPDGTGVILSGGGSDGTIGMKRIKEQGGLLLVQDPGEAEHDAMPRNAINTGLVDFVLPVRELVQKLIDVHRTVDLYQRPDRPEDLSDHEEEVLEKILKEVQTHVGHDFSGYKRPTVLRRIQRRMRVMQADDLESYLHQLKEDPQEAEALFKDILISVTQFFRDPEAWEVLATEVVPKLFKDKTRDDELRVWIAGCATGEEAYSIAIVLLEHAATLEDPPHIQIFASDLDEDALAVAREGRYPEAITTDVSEERITRFFSRDGEHYRVKREVRDMIVFAAHDLLRDPPFSRVELISCRNLLIYLQRDLQRKVFGVFHYALRPRGYLFVGNSETVSGDSNLFRAIGKKQRIYQQRPIEGGKVQLPDLPLKMTPRRRTKQSSLGGADGRAHTTRVERHLESLEKHAPPSILVDEDNDILHLSPTAGRYLRYPGGSPTRNVLRAVRAELSTVLDRALHAAFSENRATSSGPVELAIEGERRQVHLMVRLTREAQDEREALVMFAEAEATDLLEDGSSGTTDPRVRALEEELKRTRKRLQSTIADYESSEEDLKAANEELQSINEEYKSTLEELETGKEELQSVNEELHTVNNELQTNLDELGRANNDLKNLISSSEVATIFLDHELKIKRFTPKVRELFNVRTSDEGRPLTHLAHHFADYDNLGADAEKVLQTLVPVEREVKKTEGNWFLVRFLPYRTVDDRIEGVVITFVDISRLKQVQNNLRDLASQLVVAEEQERHRIAQLLHDDLQQMLFAAQMKLRKLSSDTERVDSSTLNQIIGEVSAILDEAVEETRNLAVDLSPPVRAGKDLSSALEWLVRSMDEMHGLQVQVERGETFRVRQEEIRILLFKIIRELLFNVVKHADVDRAEVSLQASDNQLVVRVSDRGKGFESDGAFGEQEQKLSFGLPSVHERIQFLGGHVDVDSTPGEGTQVTVTIPVGSQTTD